MHRSFLHTLPRPVLRHPLLETGQGVLLVVLVGAMGVAPLLIPSLIVALAVLTALNDLIGRRAFERSLWAAIRAPAGAAWLAFCGYALITALWSSEPAFAATTVLQTGAVVVSAAYLAVALPELIATLDDARRRWFMRGIPIGAAVVLGFILFELASGHAIFRWVLDWAPWLLGDQSKEVFREGGRIVRIEPFRLDRSVASAVLLAPALLFALSLWQPERLRLIVLIGASVATVAAVLLSASETAKVAALAGLIAFAFARLWPRRTLQALAVLLVAGTLLALPLGRLPYALGLHDAQWLPLSARERVLIWNHTAEAAAERPLFGIGVQSTRFQGAAPKGAPGEVTDRQLGWHAHNVYLQSWLELGAAGTLTLLAAALATLRAALLLHPALLPYGAALIAGVMTIAATGWGMWQPWLAGNVAAACLLIAMLDRDVRQRTSGGRLAPLSVA